MRWYFPYGIGIAIALSAMALGSCSRFPEITVYNNSGQELVLKLQPRFPWLASSSRIPAGGRKTVVGGLMPPPGVVLTQGGCVYAYDTPPLDWTYFKAQVDYPRNTNVQVEPDLSVVLLPVTATAIMPEARDLPLQKQYGFPVRPVSQSCGGSRP